MGDFEDEAGGAEVVVVVAELRIHQGEAVRLSQGGELVMVHDDAVHAVLAQLCHLCQRGGAAVQRDEQVRLSKLLVVLRDAVVAEAVALLHARREEEVGVEPVGLQNEVHQRHRCHAIDIIVAVEHDLLFFVHGPQDALHGGTHLRQDGGISQ